MTETAQILSAATSDPVLAELFDELIRRVQSGDHVDIEEYVRRYPARSDELRRVLPAIEMLVELGRSAASHSSARPSPTRRPSDGSSLDPTATDPGTFGDFRIVRELGRGGMGVVYEAEQISVGRRVALKVLPFASVLDPKQLARFRNEVHAAGQLHHSNIVPIFTVGTDRGVHYYAMQFIEGQTLAELIATLRGNMHSTQPTVLNNRSHAAESGDADTPQHRYTVTNFDLLPSATGTAPSTAKFVLTTDSLTNPRVFCRTVAKLAIQAAEALDHAHQVGIIHRDIKPSNVLVDVRGNLWVTDFGLARVSSDANLTMSGDLIGTIRYMSPEQALARRVVVDHRTDIYSLGVTLYELLTLRPVFTGRDRHEILRQIAFDEPAAPRRTNPSIPAELETIVLKAMAKNPAERYATAQELADDLRRHLDDKAILARPPGPLRRLVKWSSRHRALVWSAVAGMAAAFAVLAASIGWIISERSWRQTETEREVVRALEEAERHVNAGNWAEARTAMGRAGGLLVTGPASPDIRRCVEQLQADLQMIDRIERVREDDAAMLDGVHDYAALDRRYRDAFRDYGIEIDTMTADKASETVGQRTIRSELVVALDHWSFIRRRAGAPDASRLLAVARAADPDDLRGRIRAGIEQNDLEEILSTRSAQEIARLPAASVILLASALGEQGNVKHAVTILQAAQRENPGDLRINLALADDLHTLSRWDEMLHFAGVAQALRPESAAAMLSIADALRHKGALDDAVTLCEAAIRTKPDNPHAFKTFGLVREDQGNWGEAVIQFRKASELDPQSADALNHLARCLTKQGTKGALDLAIEELHKAIKLKPTYAAFYENLGIALDRKGRSDEAIQSLLTAIELNPASAQAHTDLGVVLVKRGELSAGIAKHERAIELDPARAQPHVNLGNAFRIRNDAERAIEEYRRAIELNPQLAVSYFNLAQTLMDHGRFAEAREYLRHGQEASLRDRYGGRYPWSERLLVCERMMELEEKLPGVLAGGPVADAAERADYGLLCYSKGLHAASVRFYREAFEEEPRLGEEAAGNHRYTAACSAVLAGCGRTQDADSAELDESARQQLRRQALEWLHVKLEQLEIVLRSDDPRRRQLALAQLRYWLVEPDLVAVRDPGTTGLSSLPQAEQQLWRSLWRQVAEVLQEGTGPDQRP